MLEIDCKHKNLFLCGGTVLDRIKLLPRRKTEKSGL